MNESIAIVGMSGRFPKANGIETFWENVRNGRECISVFGESELEAGGVEFPRRDPRLVKARGFLEDADKFDAAFFGFSPREAEVMDPQQRIFLECAWSALEDAGCDPEREERLIGVFASASVNTYLVSNLLSRADVLDSLSAYQIVLANDKDFLTTRVSYKLNLRGPSVNVQTACSSSLVAVCLACQNLLTFQCDLALAGAVSVTFPQKQIHFYQGGGIASPDGHCRAFDANAAGTVPGEGAGVVVLKRLSDALADGDAIYAVIKGFAMNNDGARKIGYTAPSEIGQAEAIAWAHAMAGVNPASIGYIEAHGTATPLGDPIEIAGLTRAFRAGTQRKNFCAIGSIKTHIGHLDAAAGVAGLINAALALHHKMLPPSLNFETPNPQIDFAGSPFYVNTRAAEWKAGSAPRRAGVSSFGIGSTNAHVVLEEAPTAEKAGSPPSPQLLVLSAKTPAALDAMAENLAQHLKKNPGENLADVAHTLQTGRRIFEHRRALVCRGIADAIEKLANSGAQPRPAPQTEFEMNLAMLGERWIAGEPVDFTEIHRGKAGRRAHLPAYPFERKRFWIEPVPVTLAPRVTLENRNNLAPEIICVSELIGENGARQAPSAEAAASKTPGRDVAADLRSLFGKLSGFDLSAADGSTMFLELGFDSLMLTQASQDIEKHFGVRIPFGRLIATLSTFDLLTAHVAQAAEKNGSAKTENGATNGVEKQIVASAANGN